jgi:hypothetical protein
MTTNQAGDLGEISDEEIRSKRMTTLLGAYELMKVFKEVAENTAIGEKNSSLTVEEYITEWKNLKERDKIVGKIQRHKIAGLMAAAIVRNRPLQDIFPDDCSLTNSRDNEKFAVYHGLAICAEGCSEDRIKSLVNNPNFAAWVDDFVTLLRFGSPCSQSLIHIFGTLCLAFFPENFDTGRTKTSH